MLCKCGGNMLLEDSLELFRVEGKTSLVRFQISSSSSQEYVVAPLLLVFSHLTSIDYLRIEEPCNL